MYPIRYREDMAETTPDAPISTVSMACACFSGDSQWTSGRGRMRLEGVCGTGGVLVVAKTHSGSVEICDRQL